MSRTSPRPRSTTHAETALRREVVLAALAGLDGAERDLVALKFQGGLSNTEIASALGLSESNVGTKLHRAVDQAEGGLP